MGRGSQPASTAADTGNKLAGTYSGNAGSIFSALSPMLTSEAAHPPGMAPMDLAATDTAAQQSAGGSQAGAIGQGRLRAAATRNAGGSDAAIAESSRAAGRSLSDAATGTRLKNAALKQTQRQSALTGLEGLFGANVGGGNQALSSVASNVNADTNAENASWDWAKDLFVPILQSAGASKRIGG